MLPEKSLHVGAVLQPDWDERPLRIIAFDRHEVMYDSWWPHKSAWGYASLKGKISYYRVPRSLAVKRSTFVRTDPLTNAELDAHRPDLPLRFGTLPDTEWPDPAGLSRFSAVTSAMKKTPPLRAAKLVLCPFGPKGRSLKGILVEAEDGAAFSLPEVLSCAAALQAPHLPANRPKRGVGLFRLGLERGIPSYYLWGHRSMAEGHP